MKSIRPITYALLLVIIAVSLGCQESTDSSVMSTSASYKTPTPGPEISKKSEKAAPGISKKSEKAAPGISKEYDSSEAEVVDIDELVELAEGNIVAADQYKGKIVTAEGLIASLDQDKIIVAGLVSGAEAKSFGYLDGVSNGFHCFYSKSDEARVLQLRTGDSITVTGKFTGWDTWSTAAQIENCQFTSTNP